MTESVRQITVQPVQRRGEQAADGRRPHSPLGSHAPVAVPGLVWPTEAAEDQVPAGPAAIGAGAAEPVIRRSKIADPATVASTVAKDAGKLATDVTAPITDTVNVAAASRSRSVRDMGVELNRRLAALGPAPKAPALTKLLQYNNDVWRESQEIGRLTGSDLKATVLFGTEITFSSPAITNLKDRKQDTDPTVWSTAGKLLTDWAKAVTQQWGGDVDVRAADPSTHENARRFVFTYSGYGGAGETWWYQTNVDNACIELQTVPTSLGDFENWVIAAWAESIFTTAASVGLGPGMGGGHISVDRASSFGDSVIAFSSLIETYNAMAKAKQIHADYADPDAPFVHEMEKRGTGAKLQSAYQALMKANKEALVDPSKSVPTVKSVRDELWSLYGTAKPFTTPEPTESARYTALNVKPVEHATEKSSQRVEFRRYDAQTGLAQLIEQLTQLIGLLDASLQAT